MCISDQHLDHETVEIDDFIFAKGNSITLQLTKFPHYTTSMKEFSETLNEANKIFDEIHEKVTEEYLQVQQPLENEVIEWRMKTNVLLTRVIERVQSHREEIDIITEQGDEIRRETDTFRSLSMITTTLEKLKQLFQSDVEINLDLKKIHKENIPAQMADQHGDNWAAVTSKLTQSKDNAYFPHLAQRVGTKFEQNYETAFLCSTRNGDFVVAGTNIVKKFEIRLISRLGELIWEREPSNKWSRIDDMEEIEDQEGNRWILCSNFAEGQIVRVSFTDGAVEEVVFEHPTFKPFLMTAAPDNQRLYVVDAAEEGFSVGAVDTTVSPYQIIPEWEPLRIDSFTPVKILHLPQTKSLLIAVRNKGICEPFF